MFQYFEHALNTNSLSRPCSDTVGVCVFQYPMPRLHTNEEVMANAKKICDIVKGTKIGKTGALSWRIRQLGFICFHCVACPISQIVAWPHCSCHPNSFLLFCRFPPSISFYVLALSLLAFHARTWIRHKSTTTINEIW